MASLVIYDKFRENMIINAASPNSINFSATDIIKVALTTISYVPNVATDLFFSTPAVAEVTGAGYIAGGIIVTSTVSGHGTPIIKVSFTNPTWVQSTGGFLNARYAIIYKATGVNSTSPLIGYIDLGGPQSNVGTDVSIGFDQTNGAFTLG